MFRWIINKVAKAIFMVWVFSGCGIILAGASTVYSYKGKSAAEAFFMGFMFFLLYALYASFAFGVANATDKQKITKPTR